MSVFLYIYIFNIFPKHYLIFSRIAERSYRSLFAFILHPNIILQLTYFCRTFRVVFSKIRKVWIQNIYPLHVYILSNKYPICSKNTLHYLKICSYKVLEVFNAILWFINDHSLEK